MIDLTRNDILERKIKSARVVGVGASGSKIVLELVKLGVEEISIEDFGVVKEHNLTNQEYPLGAVGMNKAEALKKVVKSRYDYDLVIADEGSVGKVDVYFNCIDDYDNRKKYRDKAKFGLYFETAFDVYESDVFVSRGNVSGIEKMVREGEGSSQITSACGSRLTVSTCVNTLVGQTIWLLIKEFRNDMTLEEGVYTNSMGSMRYGKFTREVVDVIDIEE